MIGSNVARLALVALLAALVLSGVVSTWMLLRRRPGLRRRRRLLLSRAERHRAPAGADRPALRGQRRRAGPRPGVAVRRPGAGRRADRELHQRPRGPRGRRAGPRGRRGHLRGLHRAALARCAWTARAGAPRGRRSGVVALGLDQGGPRLHVARPAAAHAPRADPRRELPRRRARCSSASPRSPRTRLDGGAQAYGAIMSAFGGGSLAGLAVAGAARRPPAAYLGHVLLGVCAAFGVGLAVLGFAHTLVGALVPAACMGFAAGYLTVDVLRLDPGAHAAAAHGAHDEPHHLRLGGPRAALAGARRPRRPAQRHRAVRRLGGRCWRSSSRAPGSCRRCARWVWRWRRPTAAARRRRAPPPLSDDRRPPG